MTHVWDPETYDRDFGFVSALGADVLGWLDPMPGETIIDLGCGSGELAALLVDQGAQVVGIDSDAAMVAAAAARVPEGTFFVADGHDFSVDQPADAVFSNAALHWMTSPAEVVGCVHDALVPGGRFVAEFGAAGNVVRIRSALSQALAERGHSEPEWPWYFPTAAEYAVLLEGSGFEVRALELLDRPTRLTGGETGLAGWVAMFAQSVLDELEPAERTVVLSRAGDFSRETLWRDGAWWADYRRLRVRAIRVA